jgi:hypothetical protein
MSWYKTEDARWLYDLFSKLAPYWDLLDNIRRMVGSQQMRDIVKNWLVQEGCKPIVYTGIFQCDNTYVRLGSAFSCWFLFQEKEKGSYESFYPFEVGLRTYTFYVHICGDELSINLNNQKVILVSTVLAGQSPAGELDIDFTLYLPSIKETISFAVFISPIEIEWRYITKEDREKLKGIGLTVPGILSAIYNNEKVRIAFEGNVKKIHRDSIQDFTCSSNIPPLLTLLFLH